MTMSIDMSKHSKYMKIDDISLMYFNIPSEGVSLEKLNVFFTDRVNDSRIIKDTVEFLIILDCLKRENDTIFFVNPKIKIAYFESLFVEKVINFCINNGQVISNGSIVLENGNLVMEKNSFSIKYFALRNFLLANHFLVEYKKMYKFPDKYFSLIATVCREESFRLTIEDLKYQLLKKEEIGKRAEEYVMNYEKKRLKNKIPIRISDFDVSAGYDIQSYMSDESEIADRFIEVKCYSKNRHFFWSKNEIEVAKSYQQSYFLYLVDSSFSENPIIIQNPYINIYENSRVEWKMESIKVFIDSEVTRFN